MVNAFNMMGLALSDLESLASLLESIATIGVILAGLYWFIYKRERYPRVDFDVALEFLGTKEEWWIVVVVASLENKGSVRHEVQDFGFKIKYLATYDSLVDRGYEKDGQLLVSRELTPGSWLGGHDYTFVEPGTKAVYRYLAKLPSEAAMVVVRGYFRYKSKRREKSIESYESLKFYRVCWPEELPLHPAPNTAPTADG